MELRTSFKIWTILGASYIFLICFLVHDSEAKSIGGGFEFKSAPWIKDPLESSPGMNKFSNLLSIKSNEITPQRSFQEYLDAIIRREKRLKQHGVRLTENSRKRRTIMFKIFVFFKILAKEVLFFGKKIFKFG